MRLSHTELRRQGLTHGRNILDAKNLDTARCSGAYIAVTTLAYRDWSDSEQSEVPTLLSSSPCVGGALGFGLALGSGTLRSWAGIRRIDLALGGVSRVR